VTFGEGVETARRGDVLFYLPDGIAPWPNQPVEWALRFFLNFFGGRRDLVDDIIDRLDIAPLMRRRIGALSQGQRKRALLAMGLLAPQPVLLIDEPFEGLDLRQSREIVKTLRRYASLGGRLFSSIHQIIDAGRVCDRFVLLSGGRARGRARLTNWRRWPGAGPAPRRRPISRRSSLLSPSRPWSHLVRKEWRELLASRAWWVMIFLIGPLVGVSFIGAVRTYAEASGLGGTSIGVGEAFSPLDGIWVPLFVAYEIAARSSFLSWPFVWSPATARAER